MATDPATGPLSRLQRQFRSDLARAGASYLGLALDAFHSRSLADSGRTQALVGVLSIAVELMLKAHIANLHLSLLFKDMPLNLRAALAARNSLPKDFKLRQHEIDLTDARFKTLGLDECISVFYAFFPEHRQQLRPYLRTLARCRNQALHFALPEYQRYELDRTVYLALRLAEVLSKDGALGLFSYSLQDRDRRFLEKYDHGRVERVKKVLADAREKAKTIEHESSISIDDWDALPISCPACGNDALAYGETQLDGSGPDDVFLMFFADSLECQECGLYLSDVRELDLAGVDTSYERDEDMDKWMAENAEYEP